MHLLKHAIQTEQFLYIALDVYSLYAHSFVGAFTAISRSPLHSCHLQYKHCGEDRKHVWIWLYVCRMVIPAVTCIYIYLSNASFLSALHTVFGDIGHPSCYFYIYLNNASFLSALHTVFGDIGHPSCYLYTVVSR